VNGPTSDMQFTDLNDLDALAALDSEDVLGAVERFAEQCGEAWEIGLAAADLPEGEGIDSCVVLGMGGSGVSGDVVRSVIEPRFPFPFLVLKSYGPLPVWVGRNTLVFAVSYSGSTEETVAAASEAHDRGARLVLVSSGGPLAEMASSFDAAHVAIPGGLQPRASLGYLTLPILGVMHTIGLVEDFGLDVDEAVQVLQDLGRRCHRTREVSENPAKDLARRLQGKIPIIYGGHGLTAAAAMRFKCDLNEYGKSPAFWNAFPELNHNEIVGWTGLRDVTARHAAIVLLRDAEEHPRISLRFEITRELIEEAASEVVEIRSEGTSDLARILSLVLVTQLAAIYVGLAHGVDPGPVHVIEKLKARLAERR
jgi:glucose/mannose-6-phosphate isomerase